MNLKSMINLTTNKSELETEFSNAFRISYGIACGLLIIAGTLGNTIIPLIVKRNKQLRNRTYVWLVNLSVADLLICVVCLPVTFTNTVLSIDWILGDIGCKITSYIIHVSFAVSALTLLAISWDRFRAVVCPLRSSASTRGKTGRTCYAIIAVIWILAAIVMLPIANAHTVEVRHKPNGETFKICKDSWPNPVSEKYYWIFLFICYGLVIIQMVVLYSIIGKVLFPQRITSEDCCSNRLVHLRSRTKTIKMLCVIVVLFVVLWSPYFVLKVLKVLKSDRSNKIPPKAFAATSMLGIFNSLCNFVVYAAMNKFFRDGVKELFQKRIKRRRICPIQLQNVGN